MRLLKLTLVLGCFGMLSCNQDDLGVTIFSKKGIVLDGSQVVPAKSVSANGTIDYAYNQTTRVLTYTIKWNSLTGNPSSMHIHGLGSVGFNAPITQTISGFTAATSGTYTGTLLVDGVAIKESDILSGEYYIDVHTTANTGGEIRTQIKF